MPSEWGTDLDFGSPDTGVGVMDQPATDNGAATTPAGSPTAPEVQQLPDGQGVKTAAKPAAADAAKSEKDGAAKAELPKDYSDVPFHKHPLFQQLLKERGEFENQLKEASPLVEALKEKGIQTAEDAAFIIQERDDLKTQLVTTVNQFAQYQQRYEADPAGFAIQLQKQNPQAWNKIVYPIGLGTLTDLANQYAREAHKVDVSTQEGLDRRASLLDKEAFLRETGGWYQKNYGTYASTATQQPNRQSVDFQRERQELDRQKGEFQKQQDERWEGEVSAGIDGQITGLIDKWVDGVQFLDDEQKQDFYQSVAAQVKDEIRDTEASRRAWNSVMGTERTPAQRSSIAKQYAQQAERGGRLENIIAKRMRLMGLQASASEQNRQARVDKASARKDAVGGGGGGGPVDQESRRADIYAQIDKEFSPGSPENGQAKTLWRMRL